MKISTLSLVAAALAAALVGAPATAHADEACRACRVRDEAPGYTVDISFPLDYPDPQAVADFLVADRAEFVDWVDDYGSDGRGRPYAYTVEGHRYTSARTQSLVLVIDNDTGAAHQGHPARSFRAFNVDEITRAPITFDTLLRPGAEPLGLPASECQNFAITDDAVIFFFAEGRIAPDHTGPRQIAVPRTELAPLLA